MFYTEPCGLGVDNDKWYQCKSTIEAATDISRANSETNFETREQVYDKYREELTAQFRYDSCIWSVEYFKSNGHF